MRIIVFCFICNEKHFELYQLIADCKSLLKGTPRLTEMVSIRGGRGDVIVLSVIRVVIVVGMRSGGRRWIRVSVAAGSPSTQTQSSARMTTSTRTPVSSTNTRTSAISGLVRSVSTQLICRSGLGSLRLKHKSVSEHKLRKYLIMNCYQSIRLVSFLDSDDSIAIEMCLDEALFLVLFPHGGFIPHDNQEVLRYRHNPQGHFGRAVLRLSVLGQRNDAIQPVSIQNIPV